MPRPPLRDSKEGEYPLASTPKSSTGLLLMPSRSPWKPLAWNGIQLEVPADWDPARMGRRFLLLEDAEGPTLALRWAPIAGRFDAHKTLCKLTRAVGADADATPNDPPAIWRNALKSGQGPGPETYGFGWRDGAGVLLYWPDSDIAALAGFYGNPPPPTAGPVLAALRPVAGKPTRPFQLYDIHARVPADLNLDRFQFVPGAFELAFSGTATRLLLHRWGPASMLLDGDGLLSFARRRLPSIPREAPGDEMDRRWEQSLGGPIGKLLPGKRARFEAGRIWQVSEMDRILGVIAAGPSRESARKLLETASREFRVVEEAERNDRENARPEDAPSGR